MKTITVSRSGWTAEYSGGCYIDISLGGYIVDNINILDYATGEYRMKPNPKAVRRELVAWLKEQADNLDGYREHAFYGAANARRANR